MKIAFAALALAGACVVPAHAARFTLVIHETRAELAARTQPDHAASYWAAGRSMRAKRRATSRIGRWRRGSRASRGGVTPPSPPTIARSALPRIPRCDAGCRSAARLAERGVRNRHVGRVAFEGGDFPQPHAAALGLALGGRRGTRHRLGALERRRIHGNRAHRDGGEGEETRASVAILGGNAARIAIDGVEEGGPPRASPRPAARAAANSGSGSRHGEPMGPRISPS